MRIERKWLLATMTELHEMFRAAVDQRSSVVVPRPLNRKGDVPDPRDVAADNTVRRFLRERFDVRSILSEEGEDELGAGSGTLQFVIDTVGGTDSFARNLRGRLSVSRCFPPTHPFPSRPCNRRWLATIVHRIRPSPSAVRVRGAVKNDLATLPKKLLPQGRVRGGSRAAWHAVRACVAHAHDGARRN